MTDFEQLGYNAWIEYWTDNGYSPSASVCPARYMKEGEDRSAVLRGWIRAKDEHLGRSNEAKTV
jgi:hypothetical protein